MQRARLAGSAWAKQSEQVRQGGSEGRQGTGTGQVVQGLVEDLGFNPEGGGDTGGLWAKDGWDLTQVLRGALSWLLRGGQT